LVAPRKRALCPQLDQLYPQLDEPANKEIHFQALGFKTLFAEALYDNNEVLKCRHYSKETSDCFAWNSSWTTKNSLKQIHNAVNTFRMMSSGTRKKHSVMEQYKYF